MSTQDYSQVFLIGHSLPTRVTAVDESFGFCLFDYLPNVDCFTYTCLVIFSTFFSVQPFAVTNCSTPLKVKKGDDVLCLCSSEGGNPAPTALWYENGILVNGTGYSRNLLFLKNISRSDSGTSYSCVVKSLSLSNATQVVIQVHCKQIINTNRD